MPGVENSAHGRRKVVPSKLKFSWLLDIIQYLKIQREKITGMQTGTIIFFSNSLKCQFKLLPLRQPLNFVPVGLIIVWFQEPYVPTSHHLIGCNSKSGTDQVLPLTNSLVTHRFLPIKEASSRPAFRCKRWEFKYNAFPHGILSVKLASEFISGSHFIYRTLIFFFFNWAEGAADLQRASH